MLGSEFLEGLCSLSAVVSHVGFHVVSFALSGCGLFLGWVTSCGSASLFWHD